MKKSPSIKNIDLGRGSQSRPKYIQERGQPFKLDLCLKVLQLSNSSNISHAPTKSLSKSKEKEQQTTDFLTERTNAINEFQLGVQNTQSTKNFNIKTYLRIKPSSMALPIPFDIPNNQTIIFERAMYKFDYIFEGVTPQVKVYTEVGKEVAEKFMEGFNATVFAYGNTGSGKTYTMFGEDDGLVPSVVMDVFSKFDEENNKLSCSMIEIYKQNLIDLLASQPDLQLKIKQTTPGFTITNLSIHPLKNVQHTLQLIKKGNHLKKMRETSLNVSSSRSHIIFTLYLDKWDRQNKPIHCKFNLVDLAGSEKVFKSKVQGEGLEQAKKINLSLSCLGNTISAMVKGNDHIPYRQSKLTRILKESLMGNSITRLIVTCSVSEQSIQETVSSIKFAQRAQKIQTHAEVAYSLKKYKTDKQGRSRLLKIQLEIAERKLSKIYELVASNGQICDCCKGIKEIMRCEKILSRQTDFKSPKVKMDIRSYFSTHNSYESFSLQKTDNPRISMKVKDLSHRDESNTGRESREFITKKYYDLKSENEGLKKEVRRLETSLQLLQDKISDNIPEKKKNSNVSNHLSKKIIRLGNAQDNKVARLPLFAKQNVSPKYQSSNTRFPLAESQPLNQVQPELLNHEKSVYDASLLESLRQAALKLQEASAQFKAKVFPLEIQILAEQVSYLQKCLVAREGVQNLRLENQELVFTTRQKFCYLLQELGEGVRKVFLKAEDKKIFDSWKGQIDQMKQINFKTETDLSEIVLQKIEEKEQQFSTIKREIKDEVVLDDNIQVESFCSQNQFMEVERREFFGRGSAVSASDFDFRRG